MKAGLFYKMLASFMSAVILGSVIMAVAINTATAGYFRNMVRESDISIAEELALLAGLYYEENSDWKGIENLFTVPSSAGPMGMNMRRLRMNDLPAPAEDHFVARGQLREIPVMLKDPGEVIIFSNIENQSGETAAEEGVPVYAGGEYVASIFAGSMIGSEMLPVQKEFLFLVRNAILISSAAMLLVILAVVWLLVRHIIKPLELLHRASVKVAGGDFETRVNIDRNDELGELAESFNLMTGSLKESEEWKKQIIADSAHELRTPVSLIQGNLEMMLEGVYPIDEKQIQGIYEETVRLSALISELQNLSSAESGSGTYSWTELSINEIAETAVSNFSAVLRERRIKADFRLDENLPPVAGDRLKLLQVFTNIISNAIKFSPESGHLELTTGMTAEGFVFASIRDQGPGIPQEERARIFERFYRIDNHRNRSLGGSGLGLAITREIINAHGGRITADEPGTGGGALITFFIPVNRK